MQIKQLEDIASSKGITEKDMAVATGYKEATIKRLFETKYCPSFEIFINLASAVGATVTIEENE